MELVYCYIKKYNSLKNAEFNFGWKCKFGFNAVTNRLTVIRDDNYIEDFFSKNFSNISAIVGENGSGKSSIIEFLIRYLPSGNAAYSPEAIVIHFDNRENLLVIYLGPSFSDIRIDVNGFKCQILYSLRNEHEYGDIVYYTNSFYDRITDADTAGLLNISLKNLLLNRDSKNYFLTTQERNVRQVHFNFRFQEYWRILRLSQSGLDFGIDFKLPDFLVLYINETREELLDGRAGKEVEALGFINKYYQDFLQFQTDPVEQYIITLERAMLFDWLVHFKDHISLAAINFYDLKQEKRAILFRVLENFADLLPIETFLSHTEDLLRKYSVHTSVIAAWLEISKIEQGIFKEYIDNLQKVYNWDSRFLSIGFSFNASSLDEFSSGQMAVLTMLARFYSLSEQEQRFANLQITGNVLILIDEGELYLHPSWQKKFVFLLIKTLPQIFKKSTIQIIMTSHSPFVLSDLPKSKVCFLTDKGNVIPSTSEVLQHKQTFASNIHTLLSDTFFLQNGFIGEYATEVINEVIKDLNSLTKILPERKEQIKRIILSVGEPIIKRKLFEMFESRYNLDIEERISNIERRLDI